MRKWLLVRVKLAVHRTAAGAEKLSLCVLMPVGANRFLVAMVQRNLVTAKTVMQTSEKYVITLSIAIPTVNQFEQYMYNYNTLTSDVGMNEVNLALGKTAQQSTVYRNRQKYVASGAVDGCLDSHASGDCGCALTENYSQSRTHWWSVDLASDFVVRRIWILNRGDCCCKFPFFFQFKTRAEVACTR